MLYKYLLISIRLCEMSLCQFFTNSMLKSANHPDNYSKQLSIFVFLRLKIKLDMLLGHLKTISIFHVFFIFIFFKFNYIFCRTQSKEALILFFDFFLSSNWQITCLFFLGVPEVVNIKKANVPYVKR